MQNALLATSLNNTLDIKKGVFDEIYSLFINKTNLLFYTPFADYRRIYEGVF